MNYYIGTDRYGNYDLAHGVEWRRHKYIRKEGKRYIYPEDVRSEQVDKYQRDGKKKTKEYQRRAQIEAHDKAVRNEDNIRREQAKGVTRTANYIRQGIRSVNKDIDQNSTGYKQAEREMVNDWMRNRNKSIFNDLKDYGAASERDYVNSKKILGQKAAEAFGHMKMPSLAGRGVSAITKSRVNKLLLKNVIQGARSKIFKKKK